MSEKIVQSENSKRGSFFDKSHTVENEISNCFPDSNDDSDILISAEETSTGLKFNSGFKLASTRANKDSAIASIGAGGVRGLQVAEQGIIGAILVDNSHYDLVSLRLTQLDFFDPIASQVYLAISNIIEGRVDGVTVADPFSVSVQPGIARLITIQKLKSWCLEKSESTNNVAGIVSSHAQLVHDAAVNRRMDASLVDATNMLAQEGSVSQKSEELVRIIENGASSAKISTVKSAGEFAIKAINEMAAQAKSGKAIPGLAMGFADVDLMLAGLKGGELIVIAARPGVGKTALAMSAITHIAKQGIPGLLYSMEMPGEQLAKRVISIVSGVDGESIRLASLSASEWEAVISAGNFISTLPLYFNDTAEVSLSALRANAKRLHKQGKLGILIIDYLQLMEGNPKLSREQQISEISRGLKKLALEFNVPVVALSQLNRKLEERVDKTPLISDLRESGAIEQDADVILFLHEKGSKKNIHSRVVEIDLIVAKQRSGPVGTVPLLYCRDTTKFRDM